MIVGSITVRGISGNGEQDMNKNYYDENYSSTNRDRKMSPKRGFGYCGCDRAMVGDGQKCPLCGSRSGKKRLKR